tara:strand:+ start:21305 stop:24979 length:3675 start_codon:yes stop_codon:yes gene_type:complete
MSRCAPFVQGVLAYSNTDLIANGFIPETGTVRDEEVRVIPASRIAIEMQYSVRSDVSGTTLNDLAGGAGAGGILGGLGGGAGFLLGNAIGSSLLGDFEPTTSKFIFHLTEAETRINRSITVTEAMLEEARDNDGVIQYEVRDYIIGVLGVTRTPIQFTDEELENIGSSPGATRGWTVTSEGAILANYEDFDPGSERNLFVRRVLDERKFDFRGDNYLDRDETQVFTNNGTDDLTDRVIEIKFPEALLANSDREPGDPLPEDPAEAAVAPLIPGDRIYLTYAAATDRILRQAILAKSFFFLFPGPLVERIGEDEVQAWNFKPYKFKVLKTHNVQFAPNDPVRADLRDLIRDQEIIADETLTPEQKARRLRTEDMEAMRLTEVLNNTKTKRPFIKGFYAMDARGIVAVSDLRTGEGNIEVIVPAEDINDQEWWNATIEAFIVNRPGYTNGELTDVDSANAVLRGFVFDVSDHVNAVCFDSEKFGYQRELADALAQVSKPDPDDPTKGVGFPNLDLIINGLSRRNNYDLSSAVFEPIRMSSIEGGAYFIRDCNKFFVDRTVQADMFIRTPFFFERFGDDTRVYVERFSPQFPLSRDGGIWVFSSPAAFGQRMTVDEHPYNKLSYLVFNADNADGESTLRYFEFEDNILRSQLQRTDLEPSSAERVHEAGNIDDATQSSLGVIGYDLLLGNQPGYSGGREISTDKGQIALGRRTAAETYTRKSLSFQQSSGDITVTVSGLGGAKTTSIKITYKILPGFLDNAERLISIIFPNEGNVIDNIAVPWAGGFSENRTQTIVIDTRNYSDELFRLNGEIIEFMDIETIEATSFQDEAYQACKIVSSISSTCFDQSGNWFVFYEDELAFEGDYGDQPAETDSGGNKEISCLFSPDEGDTWIDYKGIVQTVDSDDIKTPYAVVDQSTNKIHLFFIINDALMYKIVDPKLFDPADAFKAYRRPISFTATTDPLVGLAHFTEDGRKLRQSPLSVVIGNVTGEYLAEQLSISRGRRSNGFQPRVILNGDLKDFEEGFASQDYFAFQDKKGALNVVYAVNGAVYIRTSNDEGKTWEEVYEDEGETFIHKSSNVQEARDVSQLGGVYDPATGNLNLAYVVDEMIFAKSLDGSVLSKDNPIVRADLDGETTPFSPIFIVGNIPDDVRGSIISGDTPVVFPYPLSAAAIFDESMGISDNLPPVGYVSSSGITRMFYKDSFGNVRGLCFDASQVQLDTKRRGV